MRESKQGIDTIKVAENVRITVTVVLILCHKVAATCKRRVLQVGNRQDAHMEGIEQFCV